MIENLPFAGWTTYVRSCPVFLTKNTLFVPQVMKEPDCTTHTRPIIQSNSSIIIVKNIAHGRPRHDERDTSYVTIFITSIHARQSEQKARVTKSGTTRMARAQARAS